VNYDNSLVMTITVTCNLLAPSSGDPLFACGAIYLPPHSQTCSSRYLNQGSDYVLLPLIFRSDRS